MSKQDSQDGFTPLMIAVKYQREECVKLLLNAIDSRNDTIFKMSSFDFERTVLHICAEYSDESITDDPSKEVKSITDHLLEKAKLCKTDLAPVDVMRNTPLHICAQKHNLYMCNKLLSIPENYSKTESYSIPIPRLLKIRNNDGLTAFHVATEHGHYKIVERMIQAVSEPKMLIEECDQQLRTSLHIAALKGKFFQVRLEL